MTEECESNISNQSSSILNRKIMPQKRKKSLIARTWLWVLCPIATTECDRADGNKPEWPNTDPTSTTFMSGPSKLSTMHMLKCQELSVIAFCIPVWEFTTVATSDTVVCVPLCGCPQLWHSVTTVYVQAVSYSVKSWNCYARPTVHTSISPIPKQNSKTWFHPYQTKPSNIVLLNNQTMFSYIHFTNTKTKHLNMTSPILKQKFQT